MKTGKLPPETHYACQEIAADRDKLRSENEALKDTLRRILGWRETDLPEGDRCARAIEYIESVAGAALRGEGE